MDVAQLCSRFPKLWHVTFAGGWNGMQQQGLLRAVDVDPIGSQELRLDVKRIRTPAGTVTLRNQIRSRIDPTPNLDGVTPSQWWRLINGRVYFFCRRAQAEVLTQSYLQQNFDQEVIEFDTQSLLEQLNAQVEITTVNAGVFPRAKGPTRGRATFIALSDHALIDASKIKEITVTQAFPLPISSVVAVVRHESHGGKVVLYPN